MAKAQKVEVTKKELETAHELWIKFTFFTKIGVVSMVILLALMAIFLV